MSGLRQTAVTVVMVVCALVSVAAAMVAWNASHQPSKPVPPVSPVVAVVNPLPRLSQGDLCVASFEGDRKRRWAALQGKSVLVRDDPSLYEKYKEVFTDGVRLKPGDRWVSVSDPNEPLLTDIPVFRSELTPISR